MRHTKSVERHQNEERWRVIIYQWQWLYMRVCHYRTVCVRYVWRSTRSLLLNTNSSRGWKMNQSNSLWHYESDEWASAELFWSKMTSYAGMKRPKKKKAVRPKQQHTRKRVSEWKKKDETSSSTCVSFIFCFIYIYIYFINFPFPRVKFSFIYRYSRYWIPLKIVTLSNESFQNGKKKKKKKYQRHNTWRFLNIKSRE